MEHATTSAFRIVKTNSLRRSGRQVPSAVDAQPISDARSKGISDVLDSAALKVIGKDTDRLMSITDDFDEHILSGAKVIKKYWDSYQNEQATLTRKTGLFSKRTEQVTHEIMIKEFGILQRNAQKWLDTRASKGDGDKTRQAKKKACEDFIKMATEGITEVRHRLITEKLSTTPNPQPAATAGVLLEVGGCKPPAKKGSSDSFFIPSADGKTPAYIFKPKEGENVMKDRPGESEGVGVVREILSSEFNRLVAEKTRFDFGISPTCLAKLSSDDFTKGTGSQAKSRTGALQRAVPDVEGNLEDKLSGNSPDLAKIPASDVQKIAVLDFMTLQLDRNAENVLINRDSANTPRLNPIDGGFAFPSPALFDGYAEGAGASCLWKLEQAKEPFGDEALDMIKNLDPDDMVKSMKSSLKELETSAPELKGKVGADNLECIRRSILFMKEITSKLPGCSPAELGSLYAIELKPIIAASDEKALLAALKRVVVRATQKRAFDQTMDPLKDEYARLGESPPYGTRSLNAALSSLDYEVALYPELDLDIAEKIKLLKRNVKNPNPPKPADRVTRDQAGKLLAAMDGVDETFAMVSKRKDADDPWKDLSKMKIKEAQALAKYNAVTVFRRFEQLGGDKTWAEMIANFVENCYLLRPALDKRAYAVRVAFHNASDNPGTEEFNLPQKLERMETFNKLL